MAFPTDPIYKFNKDSLTDEVVNVRKSCGGGIYLDIPFNEENTDDRDAYENKRIDLSGILLNNLFRNYFNKLVLSHIYCL